MCGTVNIPKYNAITSKRYDIVSIELSNAPLTMNVLMPFIMKKRKCLTSNEQRMLQEVIFWLPFFGNPLHSISFFCAFKIS